MEEVNVVLKKELSDNVKKLVIPVGILIFSLLLLFSWSFNKSLIYDSAFGMITMKRATSWSFVLTSLSMIFTHARLRAFTVGFTTATIVYLFVSFINNIPPSFLLSPDDDDLLSTIPGIPSILTMFLFLIVQLSLLGFKARLFGFLVVILSCIAFAGYLMDIPVLYGYLPKYSTPMAMPTTGIFLLIGIWINMEIDRSMSTKRYIVNIINRITEWWNSEVMGTIKETNTVI